MAIEELEEDLVDEEEEPELAEEEPEEHVKALARIWRRKKPAGSKPAVKKKRKKPS